jgi:hypothetical protein
MATEGSFARSYLIAQLEQIEAALEELDVLPEHQADRLGRQRLLLLAAELMTALGAETESNEPATRVAPSRAPAPRQPRPEPS